LAHPEAVISAYDPEGKFARPEIEVGEPGTPGYVAVPAGSKVATPLTVQGLRAHVVAQESSGNYKAVNKETGALGRYQVMPQTGKVLAARAGLPWRQDLMNKDTPEAKAYQDKIGDAAIQDSIRAGGGNPAAIFSHYYSGSASAYKNPRGNPKTAKYVGEMLKRLSYSAAPGREVNLSHTQPGPAPETVDAREIVVTGSSEQRRGLDAFKYLDGNEILSLVQKSYATKYQNEERQAQANRQALQAEEAARRQAHADQLNGLYNGLNDGTMTQASIDEARAAGWLTDYDEIKKAQGIIDVKEKDNTDLERYGAIYSGQKANPYDKADVDAVEAGFARAVEIGQARGSKATPLHVGVEIWQKTGIVPKQMATMLRGGLVSADPNTVAVAASVAANMLNPNRNVFAGVPGEEQIVQAADNYTYQIDVLGKNAQEAAIAVANLNNPTVKKAMGESDPVRNKFVADLRKVNIEDTFVKALGLEGGWFSSDRGQFPNDRVKAEAQKTYNEIALQHFEQYQNPATALHHAEREVSRFYGVNHGQIMKFPPNKAYPAVNGSQDYVLEQAREDVVAYTGLDIPIDRVWLEPSPTGQTAQAFRAGKRVPYELHFIKKVNGFDVYDFVKAAGGKPRLFVADVTRARAAQDANAARQQKNWRGAGESDFDRAFSTPVTGGY